jgi:molybdate transport system substrate-binding protein
MTLRIPAVCGIFFAMAISQINADEVEVFAAASLTDALREIAVNYEKAGGDHILFNFSASNTLMMQIKSGAPADIFFSADEAKMDVLDKMGLITQGTRKDLLSNSLAIIVPADSTLTITAATQLTDPKIKSIALGQPQSVPAGIYAKAYLQKIGVWDQVSAKAIPCESVRAALAALETGNVDAGIVYLTDVGASKKVKVAFAVPAAEGPAITYPVALLKDSKHAAAAKKFLDYLSDPSSLKVFEKDGFITK